MKIRYLGALLAGLLPMSGLHAQIAQVDYATLTGTEFISFDNVVSGAAPGTNYEGVMLIDGVSFGERFAGQTLTPLGNFDQLGGTPTASLTLLAGDVGRNLTFFDSPAGKVLSGNGPTGFPDFDAIGEGAVSLMFVNDQSEFGFRLAGGHGGNANVSFFRGDGSLIDTIILSSLPLTSTYGFTRDGGLRDIRGISIWNDDFTGIGLTGFRHDVAVPEPETWALMLIGFGAIGYATRKRRVGEWTALSRLRA
ncbi:hypothetical protein ACFB49_07750 [Sphingomonas sp. DBB INV C78]|uniref:PEPxxWA-CTERM sorting domain-containing protein n=1 Tax=Sphingomonas sp. DBB INV C78 TaxID=3349434 RepID=UPI0036D34326